MDWAGLTTFSSALFLLVFGLLRGNEEVGSPLIVSLMATAAALLAAFLVIESRVQQPMLPAPVPQAGVHRRSAGGVGVSASMFALFLYITFYLQNHLGHSPSRRA